MSLTSYSAEGEDVLAHRLFDRLFAGQLSNAPFYVDVGAYDPLVNSNTQLFHELGWGGVVIDARPGFSDRFRKVRGERCQPMEVGVGSYKDEEHGSELFVEMSRPELSGFLSSAQIKAAQKRGAEPISSTLRPIRSLSRIISAMGAARIDLLSLDVEGYELRALEGLDLRVPRFRPKIIIVEIVPPTDYRGMLKHPTTKHLEKMHYTLVSRLHCSAIFVDSDKARER